MSKSCDVAIVGASGPAGESLLDLLDEQDFSFARIHLLAAEDSAGARLMVKGQSQRVEVIERFDFAQVAVVLFLGEPQLCEQWAARAIAAGCLVVDASGAHRAELDVPLVVAGVNDEALAGVRQRGMVACPDSQVVQTVTALRPLLNEAGLQAVTVATYQSMSTLGQEQVETLALQTGKLLNGQPVENAGFDKQAAFNLIPRLGQQDEDGNSVDEVRLATDVRRVLGLADLPVSVTCVLVPTFFGSAQVMQARMQQPVPLKRVATLLRKSSAIKLLDKPTAGGYPTPVTDVTGSDQVWIGRLRSDSFDPCSINMWIVSDNLRKGVALNSLQVAQLLIKDYL